MRIIAGTARSMPLKTIEGTDTRPTTDRIKETLFNIIQMDVPGAVFLDLFAGSGAIGLEAVSRGAKKAVFVENNRRAAACIQDNINFTKFNSYCDLKCMDFLAALRMLERRYVFDIIFMDPPYGKGLVKEALDYLENSSVIGEDTIIIAEEALSFDPDSLMGGRFEVYRVKRYKSNQHIFLRCRQKPSF